MDNIINTKTFISQLTYYIKVGIYVNKGTIKDDILERCIKMYNKFKLIEISNNLNENDEAYVRKCIKRFNLVLKVERDGRPVDIKNKENQLKMIYLSVHPSITKDNMNDMLKYANKYHIDILSKIPLTFILKEGKYQELLWQYTRLLFYITQVLISDVDSSANPRSQIVITKDKIRNNSYIYLESIMEKISEIEKNIKLNNIMELDKFLNAKLIKAEINTENLNEAKNEIKRKFAQKGLGENNSVTKLIDSLTDKLSTVSLEGGNVLQNMFSIAHSVAHDMMNDIETNPENIHQTMGIVTEIFRETMEEEDEHGNKIPTEIKNVLNSLLKAQNTENDEENAQEITKYLENIIQSEGLDRNMFYNAISTNGKIDNSKLEKFLENLQDNTNTTNN
jgi:hypothetical protein